MSHIVTVAVEMTDQIALEQACQDVGATLTRNTTATIYRNTHKGDAIQLPGWVYPVVVKNRQLVYDNYNNQWGDIRTLNRLRQRYTLHATLRQAAKMGRKVVQRQEIGGKIRLVLA